MITIAHGKCDDWHSGGFVSATRENTCVANIEIRNIVSLCPLVRNRRLGVISKPADTGFVQAGSGTVGLVVHPPHLSAHRLEEINHHLLRVLPHQEFVFSPLKMKSKLGNSEDVFLVRVNIDVVGRAGKRWRLNEGADRSRVVTLDIAFVLRTKPFDLPVMSGKLS